MKKTGRELHEDLPLGDYPERPSVNKMTSSFYTDTHDICDGQVTISRTKQSGEVWQMRCWISAEKKHFKRLSLIREFLIIFLNNSCRIEK